MVSIFESLAVETEGVKYTHLTHLKLDSSDGLSIRNSKVGIQSGVSDDRREGIPVLVRQPLTEDDTSACSPDFRCAPRLLLGDVRVAYKVPLKPLP